VLANHFQAQHKNLNQVLRSAWQDVARLQAKQESKAMRQPNFIEQIQDAVAQGQVVLIPAPAGPHSLPPAPPRDEASLAAVLCLLFDLGHSEGRILARMLAYDTSSKAELRLAASHNHRMLSINTTGVLISTLRKKLRAHDIKVTTISSLGYGLDRTARDKIHKHLARYDAGDLPARPRSKPEDSEPDMKSVTP
jgi:hypothetical protein